MDESIDKYEISEQLLIIEVKEGIGIFIEQCFVVAGALHDGHQLSVKHVGMLVIFLFVILVGLGKLEIHITALTDLFVAIA